MKTEFSTVFPFKHITRSSPSESSISGGRAIRLSASSAIALKSRSGS